MRKQIRRIIQLLPVAALVAFSSCKKSHDDVAPSNATQTSTSASAAADSSLGNEPANNSPDAVINLSQMVSSEATVAQNTFATVGSTTLYSISGKNAFYYSAGMNVTAAGAPNAYNENDAVALDYLKNAGTTGNWWGIVTNNGQPSGTPIVQSSNEPAPGFYVATTALNYQGRSSTNPRCYINSVAVPYIVLPPSILAKAKLGDFAAVINKTTGAVSYAIVGDEGEEGTIGAASINTATKTGINSSAKTGGTTASNLAYIVFPNSGNGYGRSLSDIKSNGTNLLTNFGGGPYLLSLLSQDKTTTTTTGSGTTTTTGSGTTTTGSTTGSGTTTKPTTGTGSGTTTTTTGSGTTTTKPTTPVTTPTTPVTTPTTPVTAPTISGFQVVGYLADWSGVASQVQYSKLTQINYAFALPTASGGITWISNTSLLKSVVSQGHASGTKVSISIGGWGGDNTSSFATIASSASTINTFVTNVMNYVSEYDLDGVDIDWEYPTTSNSGNYSALMEALATALHAKGKILSAAVADQDNGAGYPSSTFSFVDMFNVMAYDAGYPQSAYTEATAALSYWAGRGLPASKTMLGVPFYGDDQSDNNQLAFSSILSQYPTAYSMDVVGGWSYNGIATIQEKTKLAMTSAGGIMIWELSQDAVGTYSLLSAIYNTVKGLAVNSVIEKDNTKPSLGVDALAVLNSNPKNPSAIIFFDQRKAAVRREDLELVS